ncbi:MAG: hypothetical protein SPL29_06485 [Bacteroidales bacterium]|nr:hypothetical protein [Bacteroidales bacterium]
MGYSHGTKWNKELILKEIKKIIERFKFSSFPTLKQINTIRGCYDLSAAICKTEGVRFWAKEMDMPLVKSDTNFGKEYENKCFDILQKMRYKVDRTPTNFPYDLAANKHIKIDVKVGRLYTNKNGKYYSFNLEKKFPTCDIFVCYCIDEDGKIEKIYVVPSKIMYGKKQLSIGVKESKYDIYKNNWAIIREYDAFYKRTDF